MKKFTCLLSLIAVAFCFSGCSHGYSPQRDALVNDLVRNLRPPGMKPLGPSFRVVAVDGQEPKRRQSNFIDLPPQVIVAAGEHTLRIKIMDDARAVAECEITGVLAAGKEYVVVPGAGGRYVFVEDK